MDIYESLIGTSNVKAIQIDSYVRSRNPNAPQLGYHYATIGPRFRIRHDIAAGMMVHETNFLLFTGVVPIDYFNPAGLKGRDGQFIRFPGWYEGVHAHFERLAQYVYPSCPNQECGWFDPSHDPRHWQYQWLIEHRGRADRIVDVADLWTVSPPEEYARAVARYADEIQAVPIERPLILWPWLMVLAAGALIAYGIYKR